MLLAHVSTKFSWKTSIKYGEKSMMMVIIIKYVEIYTSNCIDGCKENNQKLILKAKSQK